MRPLSKTIYNKLSVFSVLDRDKIIVKNPQSYPHP